MSSLSINTRRVNGVVILDLEGKILIGKTNRMLHEMLRNLVLQGEKNVVLNLAAVSSIDSSGLGEIVAGFSTLAAAGGSLRLVNVPARVTDLMTITKLYTVFDIYETEAAALKSFEAEPVKIPSLLDAAVARRARARSTLL